ncbi:hypothetical protein ACS0TY_027425 [Phlomoides rotata]
MDLGKLIRRDGNFANEGFLRGQKHVLKNIKRRKNATCSSFQAPNQGNNCVEVGRFGLEGEIDSLKRDKQVLMAELVKLRQQQQQTNAHVKEMEQRIKGNELKLKQTMSFLARVMKNPTFLQQMVEQKDKMKEIEDAISKKRMKRIDHCQDIRVYVDDDARFGEETNLDEGLCVKLEPQEFGDISGFDVEFEALAMDMQEPMSMNMGDQIVQTFDNDSIENYLVTADKSFDEGFWGNLINEAIEDEINDGI